MKRGEKKPAATVVKLEAVDGLMVLANLDECGGSGWGAVAVVVADPLEARLNIANMLAERLTQQSGVTHAVATAKAGVMMGEHLLKFSPKKAEATEREPLERELLS